MASEDRAQQAAQFLHEAHQALHHFPYVAEAALLLARAVDSDVLTSEALPNEAGQHHSVAPRLPGTHGVDQARDDDRSAWCPR